MGWEAQAMLEDDTEGDQRRGDALSDASHALGASAPRTRMLRAAAEVPQKRLAP